MAGLLIAVSALALAACGGSGATTQNATDFAKTIADSSVVVIDVRTAGEYAAGHIANATNIDVESGMFEQQIASLDKSKTYAVYCHSGRRSANAASIMSKAGFTKIYNLDGGITSWVDAGQQLVTQ